VSVGIRLETQSKLIYLLIELNFLIIRSIAGSLHRRDYTNIQDNVEANPCFFLLKPIILIDNNFI
jgi:hypothetical protein